MTIVRQATSVENGWVDWDRLQNCYPELEWGDHSTSTAGCRCRMIINYLQLYNSRYYLFYKNKFMKKNNEAGNSLNAVEREPVPSRVLNPTASKGSYKTKQRSCGKAKLKKIKQIIIFLVLYNFFQLRFSAATLFRFVARQD